jgi:hypothetical protein
MESDKSLRNDIKTADINGWETNINVNQQQNTCRAAYDTNCLDMYFYVQLLFKLQNHLIEKNKLLKLSYGMP